MRQHSPLLETDGNVGVQGFRALGLQRRGGTLEAAVALEKKKSEKEIGVVIEAGLARWQAGTRVEACALGSMSGVAEALGRGEQIKTMR